MIFQLLLVHRAITIGQWMQQRKGDPIVVEYQIHCFGECSEVDQVWKLVLCIFRMFGMFITVDQKKELYHRVNTLRVERSYGVV